MYDEDNDYAELLASKQLELDRKLAAGGLASNGHDDDVGEEDEDDEEAEEGVFGAEQLFETPLDQLDSYQIFSQAIQSMFMLSEEWHDLELNGRFHFPSCRPSTGTSKCLPASHRKSWT